MLALDLTEKKDNKDLFDRIIRCLKEKSMTWEDFLFFTGSTDSKEHIFAPRLDNIYNEPSISFYKDGSLWISGAKGSVRMFKNCPYELMFNIFMQRYNEVYKNGLE